MDNGCTCILRRCVMCEKEEPLCEVFCVFEGVLSPWPSRSDEVEDVEHFLHASPFWLASVARIIVPAMDV